MGLPHLIRGFTVLVRVAARMRRVAMQSATQHSLRRSEPMRAIVNAGAPMADTLNPFSLINSDPITSMEIAKQIISRKIFANPNDLIKIASNRDFNKWSRIAAIYTLGFSDDDKQIREVIRRILEDVRDNIDIRAHAAEALGNMKDLSSVKSLRRIFEKEKAAALRESCAYALAELGV